METVLVTGGSGFIGSNFILYLLRNYPHTRVINLDKLTYASNLNNLLEVADDERYRFVRGDICDSTLAEELLSQVDAVFNFAAETHVDRSLMEGASFIDTDVRGTYVLLEAARRSSKLIRFIQVSTDEVYGDLPPGEFAKETDILRPRSPYSASKAGGDMQCIAFFETYGVPVIITRAANNIGPRQHVEKMLPLFSTSALQELPLPLYGDGRQVRDWLYVDDHCRALDLVYRKGQPGEVYNVGAGNYLENIEVAEGILDFLGRPRELIRFVADRQGHDRRYSLDSSKLRALGWAPEHDFSAALEKTVSWYRDNRWWWEPVFSGPEFQAYYQEQYGRRLAEGTPYNLPSGKRA
ncbi:MAG TPA: dTDP-glucose 4,6-dehydratase [Dehalococcoidia bacterium]|nr:dTDP-glucose 4,6-dehydratase [Dehalococcoidia bacterium]